MKITGTLLMFVVTTQLFTGCTKKRQNPSSEELIETIELSSVPEDSGKAVEAQPMKEPLIEQAVVEELASRQMSKLRHLLRIFLQKKKSLL